MLDVSYVTVRTQVLLRLPITLYRSRLPVAKVRQTRFRRISLAPLTAHVSALSAGDVRNSQVFRATRDESHIRRCDLLAADVGSQRVMVAFPGPDADKRFHR
ncbi:hypothetical protein MUNTM_11140 [Mycobacterium sp. MUNTM1]